MRKIWLIYMLILMSYSVLSAQRNVALLDAPVRSLQAVHLEGIDQELHNFVLDRGLIYVPAYIDGELGEYLLDTGAPGLILNEEPTNIDEEYIAQSCTEEVRIGSRSVEHFSFGKNELANLDALTIDLNHLSTAHGKEVSGLLGFEVFNRQTLLIDYDRRQLHVLNYSVNGDVYHPITRLPFILDGHLPVVEIQVHGQKLRLGIDTGSASNLLEQSWIDRLTDAATALPMEEVQGLDQQIQRVQVTELTDLQFGEVTTGTKFLLMNLSHLSEEGGLPLDGLLGYPFLSKYIVAIDYPKQEILLFEKESEQ